MSGLPFEAIVVDNGSAPSGQARLKSRGRLRVLCNDRNRGFAVAANQGAWTARGRYLLFLNSDVELTAAAGLRMVEALERSPWLAAVAAVGLDRDGDLRFPGFRFLNPLNQAAGLLGVKAAGGLLARKWPQTGLRIVEVDWVRASTLLVRAPVFRSLCGFDESYFFYEEDEDFCWRLHRKGYSVAVCNEVRVLDRGGGSTHNVPEWAAAALYREQLHFVQRRFGGAGKLAYRLSVTAALLAKLLRRASWLGSGARAPALSAGEASVILRSLWRTRQDSTTLR